MANTRTVGAAGDHTTVAAALAWYQTAAANHEFGVDGVGTIQFIDASGFAEDLDVDDLNYNSGIPDATSYLKITVDTDSRHAGLWSDSKAHMDGLPAQSAVIHVVEDYTFIEYLQISVDGTGNSDEGIRVEAGVTGALFSRCIIRENGTAANSTDGIYSGNWACDYSIDHCIIYGFRRAGLHAQNYNGTNTQTVNVDFCTVVNCGQDGAGTEDGGISARAAVSGSTVNMNVYNCAAIDNTTTSATDFAEGLTAGTITWAGTHNASSDTSITDVHGTTTGAKESLTLQDTAQGSGNNFIVQEKDTPNFDYLLNTEAFNDPVANGTNRAGSEPDSRQDFSIDIIGTSRPSSSIDIGASQISSVAGGANPKGPFGMPINGPLRRAA